MRVIHCVRPVSIYSDLVVDGDTTELDAQLADLPREEMMLDSIGNEVPDRLWSSWELAFFRKLALLQQFAGEPCLEIDLAA